MNENQIDLNEPLLYHVRTKDHDGSGQDEDSTPIINRTTDTTTTNTSITEFKRYDNDENYQESSNSTNQSISTNEQNYCICQQRFSLVMFIIIMMDVIASITISFVIDGTASIVYHHDQFSFSQSVIDTVWVTLVRAIVLLTFQLCHYIRSFPRRHSIILSVMNKIAGYISLLSLLYTITKFSFSVSSPSLHLMENRSLYMILLFITFLFCGIECICHFLVIGRCNIYMDDTQESASTIDATNDNISSRELTDEEEGEMENMIRSSIFVRDDHHHNDTDDNMTIGVFKIMKVLTPYYFWPTGIWNRLCIIISSLFLVIAILSTIMAPLYFGEVIDGLVSSLSSNISTTSTTIINRKLVTYTILLLFSGLFQELQSIVYHRVKKGASLRLNHHLLSHLLALPMDWHHKQRNGTTLSVQNLIQIGMKVSSIVDDYILQGIIPTMIQTGATIVVFIQVFKSPRLAAVVLCGTTLYIAITLELTSIHLLHQTESRREHGENYVTLNRIIDTVSNHLDTIKHCATEEYEIEQYQKSLDTIQRSSYKSQSIQSILCICERLILVGTVLGVLFIAVDEYEMGVLTIGQVVAVNMYIIQLCFPLHSLTLMSMKSYIKLQSICKIFLMEKQQNADEQEPVEDEELESGNRPYEVEIQNVSFSYPSQREVKQLNRISLKVPAGSTTAIVGDNGKSTLGRLLLRLDKPDQGQILINGKSLHSFTGDSLNQHRIGSVLNEDCLFLNSTFESSIRYGAQHTTEHELRKVMQVVDLDDFISTLPKGIDTMIDYRHQVSPVQKQKLAIARMLLMKNCHLYVLDTALNLDSSTEQRILVNVLGSLPTSSTKIVMTSCLSAVQQDADQIVVMYNSEIIERGSHDMLMAKGKWHEKCYASLWEQEQRKTSTYSNTLKNDINTNIPPQSPSIKDVKYTRHWHRSSIPSLISPTSKEGSPAEKYTNLSTSPATTLSHGTSRNRSRASVRKSYIPTVMNQEHEET